MSVFLSFAAAFAAGWLLLAAFDPLTGFTPSRAWAAATFRISLSLLTGIGFTSLLFLLLRMAGVSRPFPMRASEGLCLAILAALPIARRRHPSGRDSSKSPTPRILWLLLLVSGFVLLPGLVRVARMCQALPYGQWDAWANWNKRARFLALSADWRDAASPLLGPTHPEYPLLLPAFVARGWVLTGAASPAVPQATALIFFAALAGLIVGILGLVRGMAAATIGGMILFSTTSLLIWAPSQYADIPLASFILSALGLLLLSARSDSSPPLFWAGICAGLAAWTKPEGGPFALALLAAYLPASRFALRRWSSLLAGAAPGLLITAWFMLRVAPHPLGSRSVGQAMAQLSDPHRYTAVFGSLLDNLRALGSGPGHPLILLALAATLIHRSDHRRQTAALITGTAALLFLMVADAVAYLTSPFDLAWHLGNSMDRVVLQFWPGVILIVCALLPSDLDQRIARAIPVLH